MVKGDPEEQALMFSLDFFDCKRLYVHQCFMNVLPVCFILLTSLPATALSFMPKLLKTVGTWTTRRSTRRNVRNEFCCDWLKQRNTSVSPSDKRSYLYGSLASNHAFGFFFDLNTDFRFTSAKSSCSLVMYFVVRLAYMPTITAFRLSWGCC